MKKWLIFITAVMAAVMAFGLRQAFGGDVCAYLDFSKVVNLPAHEVAYKEPVTKDLCQVILKIDGRYVPVFVGRDFIIGGELFKNHRNVTMEKIKSLMKRDFKKAEGILKRAVAFSYKPKGTKKYLYVFTDPQCPYCNAAKKPLKDWADKHRVELRFVWFPVHAGSGELAEKAICSKITFTDYLKGHYGANTCKEGKDKIQLGVKVAKRLNIAGTPTFLTSSGDRVEGLNIPMLNSLMENEDGPVVSKK